MIEHIKGTVDNTDSISAEWNNAFAALACSQAKPVKATNKKPITIKPMETMTITGIV